MCWSSVKLHSDIYIRIRIDVYKNALSQLVQNSGYECHTTLNVYLVAIDIISILHSHMYRHSCKQEKNVILQLAMYIYKTIILHSHVLHAKAFPLQSNADHCHHTVNNAVPPTDQAPH